MSDVDIAALRLEIDVPVLGPNISAENAISYSFRVLLKTLVISVCSVVPYADAAIRFCAADDTASVTASTEFLAVVSAPLRVLRANSLSIARYAD